MPYKGSYWKVEVFDQMYNTGSLRLEEVKVDTETNFISKRRKDKCIYDL